MRSLFVVLLVGAFAASSDGDAQILSFLKENGLERLMPEFAANEVEWQDLPSLSREDLVDMGIKAIGPRNRLLKAISMLSTDSGSKAEKGKGSQKAEKAEKKKEEKKKEEKEEKQKQKKAEKKKVDKKKVKAEKKLSCMVAWRPVPIDEDEDDRPISSTGHTMLTRKGGLWLFGGIVFHDTGGKESQQLGHVLWNFDTQDHAWERHIPKGGMRLNRLKYNDSLEVQYTHGEASSGASDTASTRDSVAPADW
jgi:hypothetical protein